MKIEVLVLGPLANNVYLIEGDDGVIVVDPSCESEQIIHALDGRVVKAIVATHRHHDHVGALQSLREATGAPVVASTVDAPVIVGEAPILGGAPFETCPVDIRVEDGQEIELAGIAWTVMITPGHTEGSMCLYHDGEQSDGKPLLIAGDTLFQGAHGRTDFAGGSPAAMNASLARLAQLPEETVVLPGHNNLTTIGREKVWMV